MHAIKLYQKIFIYSLLCTVVIPLLSSAATSPNNTLFRRDLKVGMKGVDVQELQKFLNGNNFQVAPKGPGSTGKETTMFGLATKNALIKFQKSKDIRPATGFFGPITRANLVSTVYANLQVLIQSPLIASTTPIISQIQISPTGTLQAPKPWLVSTNRSQVDIAWNKVDATISYRIQRKQYNSGQLTFATTTNTVYSDVDVVSGNTYYYTVTAIGASGESVQSYEVYAYVSSGGSRSPSVPPDTTAPSATSIASSTTSTSATVSWTTDEAANSRVSYGTVTGTYTTATSSASFVTSHSLGLTGLSPSTLYYYVVVSSDVAGNVSTSTEKTLTTVGTVADIYSAKVLSYNPIAYWPLSETSGSTADNAQGTAARDGTYAGVTLAQHDIAEGMHVPFFDGTSDYVNVYSTSLRDAFNGAEGTLIITGVLDPEAWVDGQFRRLAVFRVNSNNRVTVYKSNESNKITYLYTAGGTAEQLIYTVPDVSTAPMQIAMTWSKTSEQVKFFFNGVQVGTSTALGTFTGSMVDAWIGSDSVTPTLPWKGYAGQAAVFTRALTNQEITDLQIPVPAPTMVRVGDTVSVASLRAQIVNEIWSGHGIPSSGATSVSLSVTDPLATYSLSPTNLLRVDQLRIVSDNNAGTPISTSSPYIWRPTATSSNNKLAIYNTGHTATNAAYNVGGQGQMIKALVEAGYTVIGYHMPFPGADSAGTVANHNAIVARTPSLNYLKFFIEPIVRGINQVQGEGFSEVFMAGISGGGWTTTLASAVDTRIGASAPIAGSLPLYMGAIGGGARDWEQFLPGLSFALPLEYTDLYVMGATDGRTQRQILNTEDTCCFYQSAYNLYPSYTTAVSTRATSLGGTWSLVWDTNNDHSISTTTRQTVLDLFGGFSR